MINFENFGFLSELSVKSHDDYRARMASFGIIGPSNT